MDEADRLADRVAIIDHGRLLVLDTPQALKARLGGGDVLELSLNGDSTGLDAIQQALHGLAGQVELSLGHGTLTLRALDLINLLPAILAALSVAGLHPSEVRLRANSLEDVFIQLTGRRLRE